MSANHDRMEFHHYLAQGNIICHSRAATNAAVIAELAACLAHNNAGLSADAIIAAVMERESLFPTVIAPGLAVPHARLDDLDRLLVALATCVPGVDFRAPEMPPVQVVVLVLSPGNNPGVHLRVISALAREFKDPARVEMLAALNRPSGVLDFFDANQMVLPDYLRVRDLMNPRVETLLEQDTLHYAIRKFAATRANEMAVVDSDGDLRGLLCLTDILKYSLPEHVMWMEDLSPIYNFQPFADMLGNSTETKVADIMREEFIRVGSHVPAVQLAKLFLTHRVQELLVVDDRGRLEGVVEMRDFCAKLFWE